MHDAFLTAIKKQDQYRGTGSIGAWLRRVTVNTVLMHLRQNYSITSSTFFLACISSSRSRDIIVHVSMG